MTTQEFESLPERCPSLIIGRLAPQQAGQLLPTVNSRLEYQVSEQGDGFCAERGHGRSPIRQGDGRRTQKAKNDIGHRSAAFERSYNVIAISRNGKVLFTISSR
jgi:hypothetical protein